MSKVSVLLEFDAPQQEAFGLFNAALESASVGEDQVTSLLDRVADHGVELEEVVPIPMFSPPQDPTPHVALASFETEATNPDMPSETVVVSAQADSAQLEALAAQPDVRVWPNSDLALLPDWGIDPSHVADSDSGLEAAAAGGVDCRPFLPGARVEEIQNLLGVQEVWNAGFKGEGVLVAIVDEGVNGDQYPVVGGLKGQVGNTPGSAPITSHGSMCAADVLIAAPEAQLFDYPFLGVPNSGGALAMFQAVLEQRRLEGTPHVVNNSYGFVRIPDKAQFPNAEVHDLAHPLHRKVLEVLASGAHVLFAAGNCGQSCPSGACHVSSVGPGKSIHGSNSLAEVITIAAVNSQHVRIGYSSQGPGMFEQKKPDLAAYSHIFGNFGPGRPGGLDQPFDNGTSAATPVASGVAALLVSAFPGIAPDRMRAALIRGARKTVEVEWDPEVGRGVVNAAGAFDALRQDVV